MVDAAPMNLDELRAVCATLPGTEEDVTLEVKILDGASPSQIPLTYNTRGDLYFNKAIASRIGLSDPPALAKVVE